MIDNINFLSNNVKGISSTNKRIKLFEYLKKYVAPNGFIFLQETHSSINDEKKWQDEFEGKLFFSHGKTNSCGVAIGFYGNKKLEIVSQKQDHLGRILLLEVKIEETQFVLINICNPNTETEQSKILDDLLDFIEDVENINNKKIIFGGDFNLFFDQNYDALGGTPTYKKRSLAKVIQIKESFDLCDIWRIRNPTTGYNQRRLDYFLVSNILQESVSETDILASFCTDYSPFFFSVSLNSGNFSRGRGLWKFNNSHLTNKNFLNGMKAHIKQNLENMNNE